MLFWMRCLIERLFLACMFLFFLSCNEHNS
jgi:hypothetical protein